MHTTTQSHKQPNSQNKHPWSPPPSAGSVANAEAMDVVGFNANDLDHLFSVLAAIVHLGNVQFEAAGEHARVKDSPALGHAADLLKV